MKNPKVVAARVLALHFTDTAEAIQEATLEVEHENGDVQYFVVPVLRMSERVSAGQKPNPSLKIGRAW